MNRFTRPLALLFVGLVLVGTLSCQVMHIRLWSPKPFGEDACAIHTIKDVPYRDDPKADGFRHRLDLILPKGKKDFPVVVLVHGGAWVMGDNRCCGLYSSVGEFLASQGFAVVLPNYRLSPGVQHPEHIKDVARAVAWTRANIAKNGGDPERLFLLGHSAGGHLVSLLATDETWLNAEGMKMADIKGVISVSGVYHIPAGPITGTIGGQGEVSLHMDQVLPLRAGDSDTPGSHGGLAVPARLDIFAPVFGKDLKERELASPVAHVHRGLPPFLLLNAEMDLPLLPGMAAEFQKALERDGCDARRIVIDKRNHNSIMFTAISPDDPAARAIVDFIKAYDKTN